MRLQLAISPVRKMPPCARFSSPEYSPEFRACVAFRRLPAVDCGAEIGSGPAQLLQTARVTLRARATQARATLLIRARDLSGAGDPAPWCGAGHAAPLPESPHATREEESHGRREERTPVARTAAVRGRRRHPGRPPFVPRYPAWSRRIPHRQKHSPRARRRERPNADRDVPQAVTVVNHPVQQSVGLWAGFPLGSHDEQLRRL